MTTNQQQLDRLESNTLVVLAAGIIATLSAAAYFVTSALATSLPIAVG
jgi:hypothetical protein